LQPRTRGKLAGSSWSDPDAGCCDGADVKALMRPLMKPRAAWCRPCGRRSTRVTAWQSPHRTERAPGATDRYAPQPPHHVVRCACACGGRALAMLGLGRRPVPRRRAGDVSVRRNARTRGRLLAESSYEPTTT